MSNEQRNSGTVTGIVEEGNRRLAKPRAVKNFPVQYGLRVQCSFRHSSCGQEMTHDRSLGRHLEYFDFPATFTELATHMQGRTPLRNRQTVLAATKGRHKGHSRGQSQAYGTTRSQNRSAASDLQCSSSKSDTGSHLAAQSMILV